jgi:hypothetical protein
MSSAKRPANFEESGTGVNLNEQLAALTDLAEALGMEIRRAPAGALDGHPGGAVARLKGREIVFLDERAPLPERLQVLAAALAGREEIAGVFLPPQIRELLDRAEGS